jgi:hypothetical protein
MIHEVIGKIDNEKPVVNINANKYNEYESIALEIARLVTTKQIQYGDSFSKAYLVMQVLYPNGISSEQMKDALVVVRIIDKLFRIANGNQGEEDAFQDITGYGLLAVVRNKR